MNIRTLAAALAASATAFCGYATDYYVDAVNGNDANSGLAPGEGNAMESFAALFEKYPSMASGSVVHAAPGVYSKGSMTTTSGRDSQGDYRVVVPAGVMLVGDSATNTVIKGEAATGVAIDSSPFGCGAGAIRCVQLGSGATIKNFTLTGGHSTAYDGNSRAGGADTPTKNAAYVLDCIITNNVAGRAAGAHRVVAVRCLFDGNRASTTGCDVMEGSAFNCLFGNLLNTESYNVYSDGPYVNNTFYGSGRCSHAAVGSSIMLYNSLILKNPSLRVSCTNSITTSDSITLCAGSTKIANEAAAKLDANYRPLRGSPCIDAASSDDYAVKFPAGLQEIESLADALGNARTVGASIDVGACEGRFGIGAANLYVNAQTGDDANDGASAGKAYRTLAAALSDAELASNDVVNVASGVYSSGTINSDSRNFRAVVPGGVTLLGAGAATTVIEGEEDRVNGTAETHWCGAAAVSCVRLNTGSTVRGFTLTKGHSPAYDSSTYGGAVFAKGTADAAYVVDCVITNNFAGRGAGLYRGTAIRCRFDGNGVLLTGTDVFNGRAWNCLFGNIVNGTEYNLYQGGPYVNCTFYGNGSVLHDSSTPMSVHNSVVLKRRGNNVTYFNCAVINTTALTDSDTDSFSLSEAEMKLDERYAPQPGSPLVDRGNGGYYDAFPVAVADAYSKADLSGGQRIYNGAVDIGALEYDWRDDFASRISKRNLTVVEANPGVVTNGSEAVSIPPECSVTIDWDLLESGPYSFRVAATGAGVTVLRDGVAMSGDADGIYRFGHEGERTATHIVISCDGSSSAVIYAFRNQKGFILSFR